jgi:hypothetical protein
MVKLFMGILIGFALVSWAVGFLTGSGGLVAAKITAPISSSNTTALNVTSTSGFPSAGYIMLQSEIITYTGKTATSFTGLTRGVDNTVAAAHPLYEKGLSVKAYTEEAGGINKAMGYDIGGILTDSGLAGIPVIVWDFFAITLPMIISWQNLDWMTGQLAIIRTILILVCAGFTLALAITGLSNLISVRRTV